MFIGFKKRARGEGKERDTHTHTHTQCERETSIHCLLYASLPGIKPVTFW